ncbi:MAG: TIGR03557 family F420-dependent LLM class oxidoreductase [Thaumarchaeota archaeon]|nr:TIGR03557 family F420-dependent LLM class oxidoreductase [Nitrososphaerota archaeon]
MRIEFGYRCPTEEYPGPTLLKRSIKAEALGFDFLCISDHFHPWFHDGGNACHSWILIAAAGASTSKIRIGSGVTASLFRYHPAIIAQAFVTLGEFYPGRIYLGLGTGEAMNEVPLGFNWPGFAERVGITMEALEIIRSLWNESFVDYKGKHFTLNKANLYVKSKGNVPIYVAAAGTTMASYAGKEGDGFMTVGSRLHEERVTKINALLNAVKAGAKEKGRDYESIPKMIELFFSYDEDYDKALQSARKWKVTALPNIVSKNVHDPRELDALGRRVDDKVFERDWLITTNLEDCLKIVEGYVKLGFNEIQFHSSSPDEDGFLDKFGRVFLPHLRESYSEK